MKTNLFDSKNPDIGIENRRLIPPIVLQDKIFIINNPKFFLALYKIGKLPDFMLFVDICGYDEIKTWLKRNHLLYGDFLENTSLYSVHCRIKYSSRMRFYVKNQSAHIKKHDLN